MLDHIKYITSIFWDDNYLYLAAFIISYIYLVFQCKKGKINGKLFLCYSAILLVAFLYNPLGYKFMFKLPTGGDLVFARLWIILPVWLTIASAITVLAFSLKKAWQKHALICTMAVTLSVCGMTILDKDAYIETTNEYKIRDEACAISDVILEDNGNESVGVFMIMPASDSDGNFMRGGNIYNGIRQYTGKFDIRVLYISDDEWNNWYLGETFEPGNLPSNEFLRRSLEVWQGNFDYEYVVEPTAEEMVAKMQYSGYELISAMDNYSVYRKMS